MKNKITGTNNTTAWTALLALSFAGWVVPARSVMIAQYEFTGPTPLISSDTNPETTAEDISINFPHRSPNLRPSGCLRWDSRRRGADPAFLCRSRR
ncbi:MAG: hypothetical protein PF795_01310, partial [Kiritimatiellae bacterium]|nr:hypothetical protein [Kiritimatiellia bacterium]